MTDKQWNLLNTEIQRRRTKLSHKSREFLRTTFCHTRESKMKCPICWNNESVFLTKRINQCKFNLRCYTCNFTFQLVIEPYQILCETCRGSGRTWHIISYPDKVGIPFWKTRICDICGGKGYLDWCSRITRVKGMS